MTEKTYSEGEIYGMPAGHEMDALIAEKVMGHSVNRDVAMFTIMATTKEPYSEGFTVLAHYSTDNSAAFEILNKLDYVCRLTKTFGMSGVVWIFKIETVEVFEETFPLAVCRAALILTLCRSRRTDDK